MNVVKIWGGLGNQMFQYAFGRASARATGQEVRFDLSWFSGKADRKYGLGAYRCTVDEIDGRLVRRLTRDKPLLRLFGIRPKMKKVREDPHCIYDQHLREARDASISGYFQAARYYEGGIRTELLEAFRPKSIPGDVAELARRIESCDAVSLHVRRGDYLKLRETYAVCGHDYYERAADRIRLSLGHPKFFVFSDDLEWCRTSLKLFGEITFVRLPYPDRPELDMYLMSRCRHNIIANSTFSWWGAYLNDHPEKLVVAPKSWYVSMKTDIVPESWIRL